MTFGAGKAYAATAPGVAATQEMSAQSTGIQAGGQEQQAQNELQVAGYDAGLQALQGHLGRENQAEGYNASGVLLQGSPLAALEQTRQLAAASIAQTQNQGLLQGQLQDQLSNQTINAGRAGVLGNENSFITGQANANISDQNNEARVAQGLITLGVGPIISGLLNPASGGTVPAPNIPTTDPNSGAGAPGTGASSPWNAPVLLQPNQAIPLPADATADIALSGDEAPAAF
jgi:hypothetical protein